MVWVIVSLVATVAYLPMVAFWNDLRVNRAPKQFEFITRLSQDAVQGAERIGQSSMDAAEKYALARQMVEAGAKRVGVKLTPAEVNGFVHVALDDMERAKAAT